MSCGREKEEARVESNKIESSARSAASVDGGEEEIVDIKARNGKYFRMAMLIKSYRLFYLTSQTSSCALQ